MQIKHHNLNGRITSMLTSMPLHPLISQTQRVKLGLNKQGRMVGSPGLLEKRTRSCVCFWFSRLRWHSLLGALLAMWSGSTERGCVQGPSWLDKPQDEKRAQDKARQIFCFWPYVATSIKILKKYIHDKDPDVKKHFKVMTSCICCQSLNTVYKNGKNNF